MAQAHSRGAAARLADCLFIAVFPVYSCSVPGTMEPPSSPVNRNGFQWFTSASTPYNPWSYPPRCRLCGSTDCDTLNLCRPCRDDLPWLGDACTRCQQPLAASGAGTGVCGRCQQQPPAFDACTALFHYQPPVDHLVKRLKFSGELALGTAAVRPAGGTHQAA